MNGQKLGGALGASVALHAGVLLLLTLLMSARPEPVATQIPPQKLDVFYLPLSGAADGGARGSRTGLSRPHPRTRDLPTPVVIEVAPPVLPAAQPTPALDAPVRAEISALVGAPGGNPFQFGPPGNGGPPGAGPGPGKGGGGRDGDPDGSGASLTNPVVLRSNEPEYTNEALAARIQGTVQLEAVVLANGTVGALRVMRSLDQVMGLDQAAIAAARKWLFRPATRQGRPVDVVVTLYLEFRIH